MTAPKIPDYRRVELRPVSGGVKVAYQWRLYRYLLSDGTTLDVEAIRDDSDVRAAVLAHTKAERIEGVAQLPVLEDPPEKPTRSVAKRVVSK